jgi:hypothetical protein
VASPGVHPSSVDGGRLPWRGAASAAIRGKSATMVARDGVVKVVSRQIW